MDLHLRDQVAVVFGGASGIGLACAVELARAGCRIALCDVSHATEEVASKLRRECQVPVIALNVDVSRQDQIETAVDQLEAELGPVQILVHAAAVGSGKFGFPFTNLTPKDWPRVLEINILGMVNVAHDIGPRMISHGRGSMAFVASVAGQIGSQTDPPYSASKAAMINLTKGLGLELARDHVRINAVCPMIGETAMLEQFMGMPDTSENRQRFLARIPLGRFTRPEDVAEAVLYLASDAANFLTGVCLDVDGGRNI